MGSYNVSCALTSTTITRDTPTLFVILAERNFRQNRNEPSSITIENFYVPYLPPIEGKYDDYGSINCIIPSITTQILENHFQAPIQNIVNFLTSPNRNRATDTFANKKELDSLSGMFIHKHVYNTLALEQERPENFSFIEQQTKLRTESIFERLIAKDENLQFEPFMDTFVPNLLKYNPYLMVDTFTQYETEGNPFYTLWILRTLFDILGREMSQSLYISEGIDDEQKRSLMAKIVEALPTDSL